MPTESLIRCVTLPVGAPVGRPWAELNAALADAWRLSTDAANWCVHAMFRRDTPNEPKTPPTVKPRGKANPAGFYSYVEYGRAFPDYRETWKGATQSLNICLRYAERKYRGERFDVMVRHNSRLLTVRYPYPFPVDADAWKTGYADGGFPTVTLTLPGHGAFTLRLKRRADFRRQLAMFRPLHDGTATKGEAAVYRNGKGDVLVKLVGHFPRTDRADKLVHAAAVHTDPNALLVVEIDGRPPFIVNGDHLRRWQAAHRVYRQRASEDGKREKRMDRRQRSHLNKSRELRCEKHNHRLDTAVHGLAAQVARFCERQGVATVAYDDADKSYIPDGFPWHRLKERVRYKLEGIGVEWIDGTQRAKGA